MSSVSSVQQTQVDELSSEIATLEADIQQKLGKGRTLRASFATKHDNAVANDIRKKLALPNLATI